MIPARTHRWQPEEIHPRVLAQTWVAMAAMLLILAGEYKFWGGRSQDAALSGAADAGGAAELIVYGLTAVILLFTVARAPRREAPSPLLFALWGYTLAMVLVSIWSPFPRLALARAFQLAVAAWVASLIARHARRAQLWLLCHVYIVVVSLSIVVGIVFPFPLIGAVGRFNWLYVHPNICGAILALSTVLLVACVLRRRAGDPRCRWPMGVYLLLTAFNIGGLMATRSRGALAGAVVGVLAVAWSASRRRSRLDLVVLGVALATAVWLLASGNIIAYLERGDSEEQIGTLNSRTEVWSQGWELFQERPVFGHGFMSARGVFLDTFDLGGAHNGFVEVLVNSGAFGTFWFAVLVVMCFRHAMRLGARRHPDGPVILGLLGCLMLLGFTESNLGQAATVHSVWLFVAVGWMAAATRWSLEGNEDGARDAGASRPVDRQPAGMTPAQPA